MSGASRIGVSLAAATLLFGCGDGPGPEPQGGATHFAGAEADPAVNRVILAATGGEVDEGEIELAIRVEAIDRLYGGSFVLTYPNDDVTVVEASAGPLVGGGRLVTSLGSANQVAGELAIGFVLDPGGELAESGDLALVRLAVKVGASAGLGFVAPAYGQETRRRAVIAEDGVLIGGVRWFGGTVTRDLE